MQGAVRTVKENNEIVVEQRTFLGICRFKWQGDKIYTQGPIAFDEWQHDEFMTLLFEALNEARQ